MEHEKSYDSLPNFTAADCKNRSTRFSSLFLRLISLVVVSLSLQFGTKSVGRQVDARIGEKVAKIGLKGRRIDRSTRSQK